MRFTEEQIIDKTPCFFLKSGQKSQKINVCSLSKLIKLYRLSIVLVLLELSSDA